MKSAITVSKKFYSYQKERFPIIILGLSLLPAALSSGAIVSSHPTVLQVLFVIIASVAYLLHIRVIDEHRDFSHDNEHHSNRPIQSGIISKEELRYVDILAVGLLVIIAAAAGYLSLIIAAGMLTYAYLAGKEFFIGESIRDHFFIYNGVNLVQMLLMQLFVYSVFSNPIPVNILVLMHFLFTTTGTIIFEFVRKLKIPGDDGTGKDTYTFYIGFNNSMIIYLFLILINVDFFLAIATRLSQHLGEMVLFSLVAIAITGSTIWIHWIKKQKQTDQLMQLSFLIAYGAFNLLIFFLAHH